MKNFLALTLLAVGTPMLLMGDEVRRTQRGNNNAYCQDDETSWFDWSLRRAARRRPPLRESADRVAADPGSSPTDALDMTLAELLRDNPVQWHGVELHAPDWSDSSHSLAATSRLLSHRMVLHVMINAYWEPLDFEIPPPDGAGTPWRRSSTRPSTRPTTFAPGPMRRVCASRPMRSSRARSCCCSPAPDETKGRTMTDAQTRLLAINTIRTLSIDAVQAANSGHPGTPMALAPLVYTIWNRVMRFDPQDPIWPNRDRFVLSNGHASMLLWSILHLTGVQAVNADYETVGKPSVTLDDIRRFRQLGSHAPGHPEYHLVSGVETTTGPLGQGIATSVGMAIAEKWLAARYNRPASTSSTTASTRSAATAA